MSDLSEILVCAVAALLVCAGGARADVIHLKSGGRIEGEIVEQADGRVQIRTINNGIVTTVDEADIASVERRPTARNVYEDMAAKLAPDDAEGHYALGVWCERHRLRDEMRAEFIRTIQIDPDHERARKALGYVRTDKGWATREQAMKARGMVQVDGKWMTREEAEKRAESQRKRKLLRTIDYAVGRIRFGAPEQSEKWHRWLSWFDDQALAWRIEALLEHDSVPIRLAACSSLGAMKYDRAIVKLVKLLLDDPSRKVREAALSALRRLDHERACEVMYDVIAGIRLMRIQDRDDQKFAEKVYHRLAVALGELGSIRSVPFLIEILYPKVEIFMSDGQGGIENLGINSVLGTPTIGEVATRHLLFGTGTVEPVIRGSDKYFFNQAAEDALKKFTGQDLGVLPRKWRAWWEKNGARLLRKHEAEQRGGEDEGEQLLREVRFDDE
ncbi:MAG: HEAT repeat domain-containing protein [Planctomycetota bacterium]